MIDFFRKVLWKANRCLWGNMAYSKPVYNACRRSAQPSSKRALLVYLAAPFRLSPSHPHFRSHQNKMQTLQIAQVLDEFGFIVDAVDLQDANFRPYCSYDLVISHRVNHAGLEGAFNEDTLKVYLSTGMNHIVQNGKLKERIEYLQQRRGVIVQPAIWESEEMPFLKIADAVVGFGNEFTVGTWNRSTSAPKWAFNNYAALYQNLWNGIGKKHESIFSFSEARDRLVKGLTWCWMYFEICRHCTSMFAQCFRRSLTVCNCIIKNSSTHPTFIHGDG